MSLIGVTDASTLRLFAFDRVLNENPITRTVFLLGTLPDGSHEGGRSRAILTIERTTLDAEATGKLIEAGGFADVQVLGSTDIYKWLLGWFGEVTADGGDTDKPTTSRRPPDVKINIIFPATDVHVRKYSKQEITMFCETSEVYERVVKPYINRFPKSRTQWVDDILAGISEADTILFDSPEFVIMPDMKWDMRTMSSLYLLAIVRDGSIRSLRDLRERHLSLLRAIRDEATRIVVTKWRMVQGAVRMYVHYQPSYYELTGSLGKDHFHVHIVNANQSGMMGMTVGQAHLLDDVISLIELDGDVFEKMTLTYGLGDQHGLSEAMLALN